MSKQNGTTLNQGDKPTLELKAEWVQQTLKVERLTTSQVPGAEEQPIGEVVTEERMSIVLPAGGSLEAARAVLAEFVSSLG
jgi:hypothetical protein